MDSSGFWIDNCYANSLVEERFISKLQSGDVPQPISLGLERQLPIKLVYRSPECLAALGETILSVCGLVEPICALALNSHFVFCHRCGARLARYLKPSELLGAIDRTWRGRRVSVSLSAESAELNQWALRYGLSVIKDGDSRLSVFIDSFICGTENLITIGPLIHAAWKLNDLVFTCHDSDGASATYSPSGWCSSCEKGAKFSKWSELEQISRFGITNDGEDLVSGVGSEGSYTIKQLLSSPISELVLASDSKLYRAVSLMKSLALGGCSFGLKTDLLDAASLARLSIVASILAAKESSASRIIIDLPFGILKGFDRAALRNLVDSQGVSAEVTVLGEPFAEELVVAEGSFTIRNKSKQRREKLLEITIPQGLEGAGKSCDLFIGERVEFSSLRILDRSQLSHTIFHRVAQEISSALERVDLVGQLVTVPVFTPAKKRSRMLGSEIGIIEQLAELYAASLDARMLGLQARDFILDNPRGAKYGCKRCRGLGVELIYEDQLPRPVARQCGVCCGSRGEPFLVDASFRGVSFLKALNQPIESSAETLSAISKLLRPLKLVRALGLAHLPLGKPIALLSGAELRKLALLRALLACHPTRALIVLVEEPQVGFGKSEALIIRELVDEALSSFRVVWVE